MTGCSVRLRPEGRHPRVSVRNMAFREPDPQELELTPEAFRQLVEEVASRLADHLATLPEQRASYPTADAVAVADSARGDAPETGQEIGPLLDLVLGPLVDATFNTASPGYLAYIPGGGLPQSAVAELVASVINRYSGVWLAAPGLVQLELDVIRWFCRMLGYGEGSGGFLTTGGSLANLSALVAARTERLGEEFLDGTYYVSDQVHHCVTKSAGLAGLPARALRTVPTDDRLRLIPDALDEAIRKDRAAGLHPFLVVASGGTTNTGAVDPLPEISRVARRHDLWLHVDAAYGGFFAMTERGREALAGLELADSVTLDPHKALFLPYGTGCLLVRDLETLRRSHGGAADYMPTLQDAAERVDFCQISPELSRDYRGLRVWLPLKLHGFGAFRRALDEKLDLARWAADELAAMPEIEVVDRPQLSVVPFRLRLPGASVEEANAANRRLLERVNDEGRVYLTGTLLDGRFTCRICVLSFRTHRDRVAEALDAIRRHAVAGVSELVSEG